MNRINYNNRRFAPIEVAANGEVGADTVFHYWQKGDVVWATYAGGRVEFGTLIAKLNADSSLEMRYSQVNTGGELQTGECHSTPEVLPDNRIRLHERWQWTSGDFSAGTSVIEEIKMEAD